MIKKILRETPRWFLLIWIVVIVTLIINLFIMNMGVNTLVLAVMNVAYAIRNSKKERYLPVLFLLLAVLFIALSLNSFFALPNSN